jgi:prophage regulatory protein
MSRTASKHKKARRDQRRTSAPGKRLALAGKSSRSEDPVCLPAEGLVKLLIVLRVFPVGQSTWWRGVADGKYPAPVRIGARSVAWRASDIRKLIESAPLARLRQSRTTRPSPEAAPVQQVS